MIVNHGSFGACPRVVLEAQAALRARLETQLRISAQLYNRAEQYEHLVRALGELLPPAMQLARG